MLTAPGLRAGSGRQLSRPPQPWSGRAQKRRVPRSVIMVSDAGEASAASFVLSGLVELEKRKSAFKQADSARAGPTAGRYPGGCKPATGTRELAERRVASCADTKGDSPMAASSSDAVMDDAPAPEVDAGPSAEELAAELAAMPEVSLDIFDVIKSSRAQHGLRHGDYLRYRQYCARRLHRIRKTLKLTQGKGRFVKRPEGTRYFGLRGQNSVDFQASPPVCLPACGGVRPDPTCRENALSACLAERLHRPAPSVGSDV